MRDETRQIQITAVFSDDTTMDVTDLVVGWNNSNPAVATVSSEGLLTSGATGTTTVTATYEGVTISINVVVVITGG